LPTVVTFDRQEFLSSRCVSRYTPFFDAFTCVINYKWRCEWVHSW